MVGKRRKVLQITAMYPSPAKPAFGTFVKSQIDSLGELADVELLVLPGGNGVMPYIWSIPEIIRALYKKRDIIHVHFGSLSSFVKLLYLGRTPLITSYCGGDLYGRIKDKDTIYFDSRIYRFFNRSLSRLDAWSITKSPNLADEIEGIAKNISIIPNGVNIDKFQELNKEECREKLGIDKYKKTILFPADTRDPRKNFKLLENSLASCNEKNYTLLTFKGRKIVPEMIPVYLNSADLVVCTSLNEGSPNIIKEAMACNCAIFSTDCGDMATLLEGVSGSKIIAFDESKWTEALNPFIDGREVIESNSREMLIKKKLDAQSVARNIIGIYEKVLDAR